MRHTANALAIFFATQSEPAFRWRSCENNGGWNFPEGYRRGPYVLIDRWDRRPPKPRKMRP
jgi:hypothetical protein